MKKFYIKLLFCTFAFMGNNLQIFAQLPPNDSTYHLVFVDNFSGTRLDSTKWLKMYPWYQWSNYQKFYCDTATPVPMAAIKVRNSNGNLDTTNCKLSGGTLKLITKKENYNGQCWTWPSCNPITNCNVNSYCDNPSNNTCWHWDTLPFYFTTAMLYSKFDFRYGYFEIKFRLPALPPSPKTFKGHGGSFWLWSGGPQPDYNDWSEIDAFEINAYDSYTGNYYQTGCCTHFREKNPHNSTNTHDTTHFIEGLPQYSPGFQPNTWHTVGVNWTSTAIEFYVDGSLQYIAHNHPDSLRQMAMVLNCGGGLVPLDNYCIPFDTVSANGTYFPYTYEIDYVKVWQLKQDCDTNVTLTSFNPATYSNKLHKSVTMGTNVNITNQSNQTFWGSDYILLNEGTYIDNQSNVLFNVNDCNKIVFFRKYNESAKGFESGTPPPPSFIDKINHNY